MSDASIAMPTTGDPEEDQRQLEAFVVREHRMNQNICPNDCGPMVWMDENSRTCPKCGFEGYRVTLHVGNGQ